MESNMEYILEKIYDLFRKNNSFILPEYIIKGIVC